MTEARKNLIKEKALSLLLQQNIRGEFALAFLDIRRISTGGKIMIDTFSSYEKRTGANIPCSADGLTVKTPSMDIILYDDKVASDGRRNWTIAHELGHVLLGHTELSQTSEREADAFAAEFLMPEAVIRYLDSLEGEAITPEIMTNYFSASITACKRRRLNLPFSDKYRPSDKELELIKRLFEPK